MWEERWGCGYIHPTVKKIASNNIASGHIENNRDIRPGEGVTPIWWWNQEQGADLPPSEIQINTRIQISESFCDIPSRIIHVNTHHNRSAGRRTGWRACPPNQSPDTIYSTTRRNGWKISGHTFYMSNFRSTTYRKEIRQTRETYILHEQGEPLYTGSKMKEHTPWRPMRKFSQYKQTVALRGAGENWKETYDLRDISPLTQEVGTRDGRNSTHKFI